MTGITGMKGLVAAGLLSLAIGVERFLNALLVDGLASYSSIRSIVAAVCTGAGGVLLTLAALTRRRS